MKKNLAAVLRVWLVLAIVSAVVLLGFRFSAEQRDRACSVAFLQEDLTFLARQNGLSEADFLTGLNAGTVYVLRDGMGYAPDGTAAFSAGVDVQKMDALAVSDPQLPLEGKATVDTTQLVLENITRAGIHAPEGFDVENFGYGGRVLRGLYLFPTYRNRMAGDDPSAISNLLFLAATDRGMRLLILRPFEQPDGRVCTDAAVYRACLSDLAQRLERRGLTLGQGISTMEARVQTDVLFWLLQASLLPLLAGAWLVCRPQKLCKWQLPLMAAAIPAMLLGWILLPGLCQKLLMLAAAVCLPAMGIVWLAGLVKQPFALCKDRPFAVQALVFTAALTGWALVCGLCVAALMSTRPYLLSADIFSGVKVSLLAPVALMGALLLWQLGKDLIPRDRKSLLALLAVLAVAAVIGAGLVLRSGDSARASALESAMRVWLERTLYARPRTKELLLGAPCVPLYLWACRRKLPRLQLVSGVGCALELTSVCNTFCHATAPLRVSVIRTLLGAGPGFVLGLLACGVLQIFWKKFLKNPL